MDARNSGPDGERGFTLIELVVVLAVLGALLATAMPIASVTIDSQRRSAVRDSLRTIATALEDFYYDHAAFPATIDEAGFAGTYFTTGVNDDTLIDPWGRGARLVFVRNTSANTVRVHSRGENGVDNGYTAEEYRITVSGAVPGLKRTRERMQVIQRALAVFVAGGGTLTGNWTTDRQALGLGDEFANDGFGTAFTLGAATRVLRSAGPDRVMNNSDDLSS